MKKLALATLGICFASGAAFAGESEPCPAAYRDLSTAAVIGHASVDTNFDGNLDTDLRVHQVGSTYIGVDQTGKIFSFDRDRDMRFDFACVVNSSGEFVRYDVTTVD